MITLDDTTKDDVTDRRVPVTVLTGFLGAGKTTLLNAILLQATAGRVAVIVNEFGDAGLDHDLIASFEDEIVLMQSGCLCCSIRGDLSKTIGLLLTRRSLGDVQFDRIVIETTGLADPGPILQTLLVDPLLARNTRMDGVVTLVDAANGPTTLDAQFEAVSQAAMADLIVLSKTDLVSTKATSRLETRLRSLNPTADIVRARSGAIEADLLWGLSRLREDVAVPQAIAWTTARPIADPDPLSNLSGLAPSTDASPAQAPHDARISSVSIVLDAPLKDAAFDQWLDTLIAFKGPDILRVKGIVFLDGIETPFVFHGVQHIFDPPVPLTNWTGTDRASRIVVIGRDIGRSDLQRSFDLLRAGQVSAEPSENLAEVPN